MKKNSIKYSVCMPVYNAESYLDRTITSILHQSFFDFEFVIVDDFSTDDSARICQEFQKKDKRIKFFKSNKNNGVLITEVEAIRQSSGEYILFLDCDDYYNYDTLEVLDSYLRDGDYEDLDMIFFGARIVANGIIINEFKEKHKLYKKEDKGQLLLRLFENNNFNALWRKLIRGDIARSIVIDDDCKNISRGNDKYLSALMYEHCTNVLFIENVLYNWVDNPDGITRKGQKHYYIDYRDKEKIYRIIADNDELSIEQKKQYIIYQSRQFKIQLNNISCLPITSKDKLDLFFDIEKSDFYNSILLQNIKEFSMFIENKLFYKKQYRLLLFVCLLKNSFSHCCLKQQNTQRRLIDEKNNSNKQ